jgi:membrane protein YdbS with pleckstrin-like domain
MHTQTHLHGIVLAWPLARAAALAAGGIVLLLSGWPASLGAPAALALAALVALRGAWRWERTRFVLTPDRVVVEYGIVRRRTAWAPRSTIAVEQGPLGRALGYGTVLTGELAIRFVPIRLVRAWASGRPRR